MRRDSLIEEVNQLTAAEADDERRRYYQLTENGRKVLSAEAKRLAVYPFQPAQVAHYFIAFLHYQSGA
jgi:DNA-binding PadR family transcriptional regulator